MIFAAGLGTRLGALTRELPKALVPVAGVPMLERVARRLVAAGADRLIVNTHHFADQIAAYVAERHGFGVEVVFSTEPLAPLETGGGLQRAAHILRADVPFFLHNVDILTDLPLEDLYAAHLESSPLATLAVMERETYRYLLFDDDGLIGREDLAKGVRIEARPAASPVRQLAFAGIHVVSPAFPPMLHRGGAYSILDPYLEAVAAGHRILPFRIDGAQWIDIGRPEQLEKATTLLRGETS